MLTNLIERDTSARDVFQNSGVIDGSFTLQEAKDALNQFLHSEIDDEISQIQYLMNQNTLKILLGLNLAF